MNSKIIITLFFALSIIVLDRLIIRLINQKVEDIKARHKYRKSSHYFSIFFIIIIAGLIWSQKLAAISIITGVIGAGIALALQEAILCIAGWFFIIIRKPFDIGDRVQIGEKIKGDVIDIRLFQISIIEIENWVAAEQSTGRIVNIPNSIFFKEPNYNYTKGFGFIWDELKVLITFESNHKLAEKKLLEIASDVCNIDIRKVKEEINKASEKFSIKFTQFTPKIYLSIEESGILLTIRYLVEVRKRRIINDNLSRKILDLVNNEKEIDFAYPTYRIVKT